MNSEDKNPITITASRQQYVLLLFFSFGVSLFLSGNIFFKEFINWLNILALLIAISGLLFSLNAFFRVPRLVLSADGLLYVSSFRRRRHWRWNELERVFIYHMLEGGRALGIKSVGTTRKHSVPSLDDEFPDFQLPGNWEISLKEVVRILNDRIDNAR